MKSSSKDILFNIKTNISTTNDLITENKIIKKKNENQIKKLKCKEKILKNNHKKCYIVNILIIIILFLFYSFRIIINKNFSKNGNKLNIYKNKIKIIKISNNDYNPSNITFNSTNNSINDIIYLSFNEFEYHFSFKYNKVEIKYKINFYNKFKELIKPSNLSLLYKLHFVCYFENLDKITTIFSFPNIISNNDFICVEYLDIFDKFKIGVKFYQNPYEEESIFIFSEYKICYNNSQYITNSLFDAGIINNDYEVF